MKSFSILLLMPCLLMLAVLGAGCHSPSDSADQSKEEAWVVLFKKELKHSRQRFFQARYIQKKDDPFYIKEVIPGLSVGKTFSRQQKEAIAIRRDDFEQSWPLLSDQLARTQLIFSVTSVLPAYQATKLLATSTSAGLDALNAGYIVTFKALVESHAVFDGRTQHLELAPQAKTDVVELANKITVRTLALIAANKGVASDVRIKLESLRSEIRLLNPQGAALAGEAVNANEAPFIEEPSKNWAELKTVYDRIFDALSAVKGEKLALIPALQEQEAMLLEKVLFATDKQFKIAGITIDAN